MITINYLIDNKFPLDKSLDDEDKKELLIENADAPYSYICLLKEMFSHYTTTRDILRGWSGVQLVKLS